MSTPTGYGDRRMTNEAFDFQEEHDPFEFDHLDVEEQADLALGLVQHAMVILDSLRRRGVFSRGAPESKGVSSRLPHASSRRRPSCQGRIWMWDMPPEL